MTKDDVIHLAEEAGWSGPKENVTYVAMLERFAILVAAAEREACAEVCELMYDYGWLDAKRCAMEIRARGQE